MSINYKGYTCNINNNTITIHLDSTIIFQITYKFITTQEIRKKAIEYISILV